MTAEKFFEELRRRFIAVLDEHDIGDEPVQITCRSLTPEEAIGKTKRQDFPIITGDDVMIQAQFRDSFGQAFTDAPTAFEGTLSEVLDPAASCRLLLRFYHSCLLQLPGLSCRQSCCHQSLR